MLVNWHSEFQVIIHTRSWKYEWWDKPRSLNHQQDKKTHDDDGFNHINACFPLHNDSIHLLYSHSHFLCQCFNFFVLITRCLFKSWPEGAALLLLLRFLPAPGEADDISRTKISMIISARYLTIPIIMELTINTPTTSRFGGNRGNQLVSVHETIPSGQHLENKSRQLNQLLTGHNPLVLSIRKSILC